MEILSLVSDLYYMYVYGLVLMLEYQYFTKKKTELFKSSVLSIVSFDNIRILYTIFLL